MVIEFDHRAGVWVAEQRHPGGRLIISEHPCFAGAMDGVMRILFGMERPERRLRVIEGGRNAAH